MNTARFKKSAPSILLKAKPFSVHPLLIFIALSVVLPTGRQAWSQTGVAPSQTSSFFDDLRNRAATYPAAAVDQRARQAPTEGVYDYSGGEYIGEAIGGAASGGPASLAGDLSQAFGAGTYKGGFPGSSKRRAGEYTSGAFSSYPSTGSYFAPAMDSFLEGRRNIKLGPVDIGLGMNTEFEYNDNITQAHSDQLDDIIGTATLNIDANYPLSERQRLSLTASIGVDHYFNHPDKSPRGKEYNFNVYPGTTLSLDFQVGEIHFVLYDRISIRQASQSDFSLDNKQVFGVFQNDIGLAANWLLNSKTQLSLNYNNSDSQALDSAQASTDRTIDSYSGSLAWTPSGTYTLGMEGSYSITNYDQDYNNDGTMLSGGVFVTVPVTHSTQIKASFGRQWFTFDKPPTFVPTTTEADVVAAQSALETFNASLPAQQAAIQNNTSLTSQQKTQQLAALTAQQETLQTTANDTQAAKAADDATAASRSFDNTSEFDGNYYNITIFNQLNARVSHQFVFGREASLNTTSNFVVADYASYGLGIIAWRGARFSLSGYFEDSQESGSRDAEKVQQQGADAILTHRLTDRLSMTLGAHYGETDSSTVGRDFQQYSYSVDFNFTMNARTNLGLGYHAFKTNAEVEEQSYKQNRVTLSLNYNF